MGRRMRGASGAGADRARDERRPGAGAAGGVRRLHHQADRHPQLSRSGEARARRRDRLAVNAESQTRAHGMAAMTKENSRHRRRPPAPRRRSRRCSTRSIPSSRPRRRSARPSSARPRLGAGTATASAPAVLALLGRGAGALRLPVHARGRSGSSPRAGHRDRVAVKEASLRIGMANVAQHIERYRQRTGRLPAHARRGRRAGGRASNYQPLDPPTGA